jgi:hypothetical protein
VIHVRADEFAVQGPCENHQPVRLADMVMTTISLIDVG